MMPLPPTTPATVHGWVGVPFSGAPAALFALDAALGSIVRTTQNPIVGQMRLTWWHDALAALDRSPAPAQPVLRALATTVVPHMTGADLAEMIAGWDVLIEVEAPDATALATYARARGATLFAALASATGIVPDARIAAAGRGWALADLAGHVGDAALAARAGAAARADLEDAGGRWRGQARAIGALAADAALAASGRGVAGGPRRATRALRLLLTGR